MATKPKTHIGTCKCPICDNEIPVKESENGTMNFACPWCDHPGYAKAGTQAHKLMSARVKRPAAAKPEDIAPVPATKAAPAPSRTVFG